MKRRKMVTAEHCLSGEFSRRELAKRLGVCPRTSGRIADRLIRTEVLTERCRTGVRGGTVKMLSINPRCRYLILRIEGERVHALLTRPDGEVMWQTVGPLDEGISLRDRLISLLKRAWSGGGFWKESERPSAVALVLEEVADESDFSGDVDLLLVGKSDPMRIAELLTGHLLHRTK